MDKKTDTIQSNNKKTSSRASSKPKKAEPNQNNGCTRTGMPNSTKFKSYGVRGGSCRNTVVSQQSPRSSAAYRGKALLDAMLTRKWASGARFQRELCSLSARRFAFGRTRAQLVVRPGDSRRTRRAV